MKKKSFVMGFILLMTLGLSTITYAAEQPAVTLTKDKVITYTATDTVNVDGTEISLLGDAFQGMAPGEEKSQEILVKNESADTVAFYISQRTIQAMEDENQASGGAYTLGLTVGKDKTPLLNTEVGGFAASDSADYASGRTEGLKAVDALDEYTFLVQLAPGEESTINMTLSLAGEGMDSLTNVNDYTDAVATIQMDFRAYDIEHEITYGQNTVVPVVLNRVVDRVTTAVKTGDTARYLVFALVLVAGVGIVSVAIWRKKKGGE